MDYLSPRDELELAASPVPGTRERSVGVTVRSMPGNVLEDLGGNGFGLAVQRRSAVFSLVHTLVWYVGCIPHRVSSIQERSLGVAQVGFSFVLEKNPCVVLDTTLPSGTLC